VRKNVFKEEVIFVDLGREETKQLSGRDNIIRKGRLGNIGLIVV
jgi:hypothetical protein